LSRRGQSSLATVASLTNVVPRASALSPDIRVKALFALLLLLSTAVADPDWDVRRDPFDARVIARYRAILARDPHDAILGRLVALYRQYRTVSALRASYDHEDWASLVVLARIERGRDDQRARALLIRAAALRDDDARTWIALGELHRPTDAAAARAAYRKALALAPTAAVRSALAELAISAGDLAEADVQLRALIALDPTPARWLAHGDAMLRSDPAVAVASYREAEARARDPYTRIDAITRQGTAHGKRGDHAQAIAALRRALALAPRGSGVEVDLVARIVDHARAGNRVAEELAVFEAAWPRRGMFEHLVLGELHEASKGFDRAVVEYEAAIAAAPREPRATRQLVGLLDRLGRPADALARFEAFAKRWPRDASIQLELARRYGRDREVEATAVLDALARTAARDASVQVAIADFYVVWQRPQLAAIAYERAAKLDPSYRSSLAKTYAAAGDRRRLGELARDADRDPKQLAELANLMLEYAMWDEARAAFSRAIELEPANPGLWSGRAGALEGRKAWAAAAEDAARALALSVNADDKARSALRHVVVHDVLQTEKAESYWRAWRTQLAREPAHRDLPALLAELERSEQITWRMRLRVLRELRAQFPHDLAIASELIDRLVDEQAYTEALILLGWLAEQPGAPRSVLAAHRKQLHQAALEYANDAAWHAAAMREGVLVDLAPRKDAASLRFRAGLRVAVGLGNEARLVRLGAVATMQLSGGVAFAGRLDWTATSASTGGPGGSLGLVTRLSETPSALWSVGGAVRIDVRPGAATPIDPAAELGIDLTSRYTPYGLGLRVGRSLGGATTANLEVVVEWR
jgi:tetratricopeptide (TPR) repeat protein